MWRVRQFVGPIAGMWMTGAAWGQDVEQVEAVEDGAPNPDLHDMDTPETSALLSELQQSLDELSAELELSRTALGEQSAKTLALNEMLGDATIVLDDRASNEQRKQALGRLEQVKDARALPFVRAASRDQSAALRLNAVRVAVAWQSDEVTALLTSRVRDEVNDQIRETAIQGLQELQRPSAGEALYGIAADPGVSNDTRRLALDALTASYPSVLEARGQPSQASDRNGTAAGVLANGLVGGIALGSIGVWGQSEAGVPIGAVGGTAIGIGTGVLYSQQNPVTRGQGLRYSSNIAWGTTGAIMLIALLEPDDNGGALLLTAGSGVGAITGFRNIPNDPRPEDVMESNLAGYLGLQLARGGVNLLEGSSGVDGDPQKVAMLLGSAAGLGAGHVLSREWAPGRQDLGLGAVLGAEAAWVGGWLPVALDLDLEAPALVNVGLHGGMAGGLLLSHRLELDPSTTGLMGYGALAGNALGAGLALIPANSQSQNITRAMLAAGIAGTGAGAWAAPQLDTSTGDQTMVAVGTGLTMVQVGTLASVLEDKGVLQHSDQGVGLVLSSGALMSGALLAASPHLDPAPLDSLFIASAGGWGYWYSGLGLVAVESDLDASTQLLIANGAADLTMALGGLIVWEGTPVEPRDTLIPQLIGVGGATLGSLVVALASENGSAIAWGALGGSTLGLAVGTGLAKGRSVEVSSARAWVPSLPRLRLDPPGQWNVAAMPVMQHDGSMGAHVSLTGFGF